MPPPTSMVFCPTKWRSCRRRGQKTRRGPGSTCWHLKVQEAAVRGGHGCRRWCHCSAAVTLQGPAPCTCSPYCMTLHDAMQYRQVGESICLSPYSLLFSLTKSQTPPKAQHYSGKHDIFSDLLVWHNGLQTVQGWADCPDMVTENDNLQIIL